MSILDSNVKKFIQHVTMSNSLDKILEKFQKTDRQLVLINYPSFRNLHSSIIEKIKSELNIIIQFKLK